jgi:hypothetical protein
LEVNFEEDLVKRYSDKRKIISLDETEDLYRILKLWLKKKLKNSNIYAFDIPYVGICHKKFKPDEILKYGRPKKKEDVLNEKMLLNLVYKEENSPPNKKPKYKYEDFERIKNHTNNST